MKIAIDGLGRRGHISFAATDRGLDIVACNEPKGTIENLALGLEFDSVQGRWRTPVTHEQRNLRIGERLVPLLQTTAWDTLPWRESGVDLVAECSGKAKNVAALPLLAAGAPRILVSNPVPEVPNLVFGVNHSNVDFARERIVTAASCTTNCLAPIVRVLARRPRHRARAGDDRSPIRPIRRPSPTGPITTRAGAARP